MSAQHTPGPVHIFKCTCGDPICSQYTLSTQGGVGFSLGDARLYAAAPDLLVALHSARDLIDDLGLKFPDADQKFDGTWASYRDEFDTVIDKAEGRDQ